MVGRRPCRAEDEGTIKGRSVALRDQNALNRQSAGISVIRGLLEVDAGKLSAVLGVSEDAADALRLAAAQLLREGTPIEKTLGLSSAGLSQLRSRALLQKRNYHLAIAGRCVCAGSEPASTWEAAGRLLGAIERFSRGCLFKLAKQGSSGPPQECSLLEESLFHAFRADDKLAQLTRNQINNILKSEGPCSFHTDDLKVLSQYV